MSDMVVKILDVGNITHDVKRFVVEKPQGYNFSPGQATDVAINRSGWQYKQRPFTFTSLNSDPDLEFIIKAYPLSKYPQHKGVSEELHKLSKGDELKLGKPWGTINYKGAGTFVAGGAGITPFVAIFRHLAKENKLKGNKLIFSNKTKEDVILEQDLRKYFPGDNLILTLTRENVKKYEYGRVDESFLQKHLSDFGGRFYICGPKPLVSDLRKTLSGLGASVDSIVFEK